MPPKNNPTPATFEAYVLLCFKSYFKWLGNALYIGFLLFLVLTYYSPSSVSNIHWIIEKAREFQKNVYFSFTDYAKAFDCGDHKNLWKILQEMGVPDLTCLLRNLYAGQEATEPDMKQLNGSKLGKEYIKAVYCHLTYLMYMQSTSCEMLDWMKHPGIKIKGRNINYLRYAADTTLMAESEELKSLLMKVKEESKKAGLKLNIQKTKIIS